MEQATLSHVFLFCFDLDNMVRFYTETVGFHLSDRGMARGRDIAFLTLSPDADHHQLAMCGGREGPNTGGPLNHIAFRVNSFAELRRRHALLSATRVAANVETVNHGAWLSVYYRDVDNNRMEFFFDTPWYIRQPMVEPLDLAKDDDEILNETYAKYKDTPGFSLMSDWKAQTKSELAFR
ncbi:VOC family protein [Paraburkholderia strydomiana]|uniref:VOC family protein n=1 Tax=Paraburkholderia strydomiana TaxID=1245417 RepID=A0ABW9ERC5_9BURK